ncbi:sensor histidine kinase [Neptunicella sp. SCSIO 80796]|uniref:sensor histidine kinase n=1 Tax=Neptunicella plasticusilytica TaxID=3117012 RepID=UPI003A4DB967
MRANLFLSFSPANSLFPQLVGLRVIYALIALVSGYLAGLTGLYWLIWGLYLLLNPTTYSARQRLVALPALALLLIIDVLALSYFIYANNGVLSGWVSALLLPAVIGSLSLSRLLAWMTTAVAMLCYALLTFIYLLPAPQPHLHLHSNNMNEHMLGMLVTFWVSAFLITAFITAQARILRKQHQHIVQQQQRQLRDEQIMAVATLTANAAHHIATPLASAQMLVEELDELPVEQRPYHQQLLAKQLLRCQQALDKVIQQGKNFDPQKSQTRQVGQWLNELCDNWWLTHNEVKLERQIDNALEHCNIEYKDSLNLAIANILDNAARACIDNQQARISLIAGLDQQQLLIEIIDNGDGIEDELIEQLGRSFVIGQGYGIGLALANASIEQAGGSVFIRNLSDGVSTQVRVPLIKSDNTQ